MSEPIVNKNKAYHAAWRLKNREKVTASSAAYRAANQDKARADQSAWRAANQDKVKAYAASYRSANLDKSKAMTLAWRVANPDKTRSDEAAWRAANRDRARASASAWQAAHPEVGRINEQNRRARKLKAGGKLSKGLSAKLFKLQKGKCPCCKQPLGDDYHMDHKMPLALGGSNIDGNIQLLRSTCNQKKSAKHPVDFMQERGFLL